MEENTYTHKIIKQAAVVPLFPAICRLAFPAVSLKPGAKNKPVLKLVLTGILSQQ